VRRTLIAVALALLILSADRTGAVADSAAPNPQEQLAIINQIRAQLGSNLADAMAAQQQLQKSLQDNAAQQTKVQAKIADVEAKIADLDRQIAEAQMRETLLSSRIASETT